jgi:hypothetical protein
MQAFLTTEDWMGWLELLQPCYQNEDHILTEQGRIKRLTENQNRPQYGRPVAMHAT